MPEKQKKGGDQSPPEMGRQIELARCRSQSADR